MTPTAATAPQIEETARRLADSDAPYLIGVRHHSPALAAVIPRLLDSYKPDAILLELPAEFESWIEWVGHPETIAPVALAAVGRDGRSLSFYPFADFSPELAVIRWARGANVPVRAADLPWGRSEWGGLRKAGVGPTNATLTPLLWKALDVADGDEFWDRAVEARAPGETPDAIRKAALTVGLAIREATPAVAEIDLAREAWMRSQLASMNGRVAAVVGSFHASGLLETVGEVDRDRSAKREIVTALIPYTFPLLDSRSGYPAGIRDPEWQQRVAAASAPEAIAAATFDFAVGIVAELRAGGHAAGTVEAQEVARVALDLGHIRGLPAPGRRELVEACATVLTQGEPLGRGRAVAKAMGAVLIGDRRGRLPTAAPRSGLGPHVEGLVAELHLPGPNDPPADLRLDPLRSELDRRRHIALMRLLACGVPYALLVPSEGLGIESLTQHWYVEWQPATSALIDLAGLHGVTLEQAAEGRLRSDWASQAEDGQVPPEVHLRGIRAASECALPLLTEERLNLLQTSFIDAASLAQLLAALDELERITRGHVPGYMPEPGLASSLSEALAPLLLVRAVQRVEGLRGSNHLDDALALGALVRRLSTSEAESGSSRLEWALRAMARDGSALMQGASTALLAMTDRLPGEAYGELLGSWIDLAIDGTARRNLTVRLNGTVVVAGPFLESATPVLSGLAARIDALADETFLDRLPAMRAGFDPLSVAGRQRFMAEVGRLVDAGGKVGLRLEAAPEMLVIWARADAAGRAAVTAERLALETEIPEMIMPVDGPAPGRPDHRIKAVDRWRLILGAETDGADPELTDFRRALDELYGGHGEGSNASLVGPGRGGSYPTVREWSRDLGELFGQRVRDEVLARAAERGRSEVVEELNPETVTPSVDLLEQMLSLAGSIPEASLGRYRTLVGRLVDQLVAELATRLRPALNGTTVRRATRRRGGPLHLSRTVRANLASSHVRPDGGVELVPDQPYFYAKGRRAFDWRVVLCVDVSGSMETSVVYSALTAAILSGLPAIKANFLAFSDRVVDLSDRVSDPLALLLEIKVGGGTNISSALRHARTLVTVPSRTIVLVVSDFEEGRPPGELVAEVRAIASSGARLLGLAALDDQGEPRYDSGVAGALVDAGMPIAALTPDQLAGWIGDQLRGG